MKKLILILAVAFGGCANNSDPVATQAPGDLSGNWAIAFDRDVICFGSMVLTQEPGGLVGTFSCGPIEGSATGNTSGNVATLSLVSTWPTGQSTTMPVTGIIDADGMSFHGKVDYPFQPGVPFAARRPFSF